MFLFDINTYINDTDHFMGRTIFNGRRLSNGSIIPGLHQITVDNLKSKGLWDDYCMVDRIINKVIIATRNVLNKYIKEISVGKNS